MVHLRYFGASTIDMCLNEMSELPCWQLGRQDLISGKLIMPSTERDVLYAYVQSGVVVCTLGQRHADTDYAGLVCTHYSRATCEFAQFAARAILVVCTLCSKHKPAGVRTN